MREERKWEDLEFDCLVNIVGRLDIESLLLDDPFVCESWHRASHDPSCWQHIDFTELPNIRRFLGEYHVKNFSIAGLVKLITARGLNSRRLNKITSVVLPTDKSNEILEVIAEKCPGLKSLSLKGYSLTRDSVLPALIEKWKLLEELTIRCWYPAVLPQVVAQIGQNCRNFSSLVVWDSKVGLWIALAIVNDLSKIKKLSLMNCHIEQEDLEIIELSRKDLAFLDVKECRYEGVSDQKKITELVLSYKDTQRAA